MRKVPLEHLGGIDHALEVIRLDPVEKFLKTENTCSNWRAPFTVRAGMTIPKPMIGMAVSTAAAIPAPSGK